MKYAVDTHGEKQGRTVCKDSRISYSPESKVCIQRSGDQLSPE